jgi:hypothetical protein
MPRKSKGIELFYESMNWKYGTVVKNGLNPFYIPFKKIAMK